MDIAWQLYLLEWPMRLLVKGVGQDMFGIFQFSELDSRHSNRYEQPFCTLLKQYDIQDENFNCFLLSGKNNCLIVSCDRKCVYCISLLLKQDS